MVCEQLVLFWGHAQRDRKAFLQEIRISIAISLSPTKIVSGYSGSSWVTMTAH
jgi:hypothetical protein